MKKEYVKYGMYALLFVLCATFTTAATHYDYSVSNNFSTDILKLNTTSYFNAFANGTNVSFRQLLELTPRVTFNITVQDNFTASNTTTHYTFFFDTVDGQYYVANQSDLTQEVGADNYTYTATTGKLNFTKQSYWVGKAVTIVYNKTFVKNSFNLVTDNDCYNTTQCDGVILNNGLTGWNQKYGIKLNESSRYGLLMNQTGWSAVWTMNVRKEAAYQCSAGLSAVVGILGVILAVGMLYFLYKWAMSAGWSVSTIVMLIVFLVILFVGMQFLQEQVTALCF
jgi:hypothetical protein